MSEQEEAARVSRLLDSVKNLVTRTVTLSGGISSSPSPFATSDEGGLINTLQRQLDEADVSKIVVLDSGNTAWMLFATALVLFMTIPGLASYYGGMVRVKSVLSTVMQSFTITCLITTLWLFYGYSLSFAPVNLSRPVTNPIFGDGSRLFMRGLKADSFHMYAPTIPEPLFCAYQMCFAILTASLICGAFADRMKYHSMICFIILWHTAVYCPIAHSVWHFDGFLKKAGVLDFAGGTVVHIASGVSGLVCAVVIGNRHMWNGLKSHPPHNILLTFMGTSMLWVGWFGFNGGSAMAADSQASMAVLVTQIAASVSSFMWMFLEWYIRKQPSVLGMINGGVAGLVCITPAAGYVDPVGAFWIGFFAGPLCYLFSVSKHYFGYDDALDAFGVHAMGGVVGCIGTGFFATRALGGADGVYYAGLTVGGKQLAMQLYAIVVCGGWAAFATFFILKFLQLTIGLRVSKEDEERGLDDSIHGESVDHSIGYTPQRVYVPATEKVKDSELTEEDNEYMKWVAETHGKGQGNDSNWHKSALDVDTFVDAEHHAGAGKHGVRKDELDVSMHSVHSQKSHHSLNSQGSGWASIASTPGR